MWPSGLVGGVAGQNPATSPAVLAGEGAGEDIGFARDRLVCGFGAERPPVSGTAVLAAATGGRGWGAPARGVAWARPTGLRGSKAS
jgi:hypothetical protein